MSEETTTPETEVESSFDIDDMISELLEDADDAENITTIEGDATQAKSKSGI